MRRATAALTFLIATTAAGQQPGFRGGFGAQNVPSLPIYPGSTAGLPLLGPIPPLGAGNPGFRSGLGGGFPVSGGGAFPIFWGGGYGAYPAISAPVTNIVMMQAVQPAAPIASASRPVAARSEVREYKEFQDATADPTPTELQYFILVMKDGARTLASLVWVQGGDLRYVTPEGSRMRVPAGQVDREATRKLNLARNMNLRLP